jgi:hypothetical protein
VLYEEHPTGRRLLMSDNTVRDLPFSPVRPVSILSLPPETGYDNRIEIQNHD